jgi:spore coat polysaccharide biosynthesis protein SpsF
MNLALEKIGFILQARVGSTRFHRKVMELINSEPLIFHVINQVRYSKYAKNIVIATTQNKEDDKIEEYLKKKSNQIFRGNEKDCLDRYYQCAKLNDFKTIVRITCDNPLIDPTLIDDAIDIFINNKYDYVTNCKPRTYPQGTEVEIFSFTALENAWKHSKKISEREHVTPYFYNNPEKFKIFNIENDTNLSHFRWTVDRIEDLDFVKIIYEKLKKSPILMKDILKLLFDEPDLIKINEKHVIDEGYLQSITNEKKEI